ncbi:MAG: hypothetical protein Q9160_008626 [Pyrenula sp. 1 TL-2023]
MPSKKKPSNNVATTPVTNYAEIQQNEVEAIRSIYMDDFDDVKTKSAAWNKTADIAFKIRIKAPTDPLIAVTLQVELTATYPKTLPFLKIENVENTSALGVLENINNVVKTTPTTLLGDEMIFTIASTIESILEDAALDQANKPHVPSLEQERMVQEATNEQVVKEKELAQARRQELETAEERRILQEQVENEIARRNQKSSPEKRRMISESGEDAISMLEVPAPETISFDQAISTKDSSGRSYKFRTIIGTTTLLRAREKLVKIVAPLSSNDIKATQLLLKQITFPENQEHLNDSRSGSTALRQKMAYLEEKLDAAKSRSHQNVVDLIGFKIQRCTEEQGSAAVFWELNLLYEFANKGSLLELLDIVGSLGPDQVRGWTIQLLDALEFFEQHSVVHPGVQVDNVFLFQSPSGATTLKLSDGHGILGELPLTTSHNNATSDLPYWLAPELSQKPPQRTTKTAIWGLGVLVLQMALGKRIVQQRTSPNDLMKSDIRLTEPFEDLLLDMFQQDQQKRPKAFQLLPSEFLRKAGPLFETEEADVSGSLEQRRRASSAPLLTISNSRYDNDFDEAGRLGKGGFGEVVKARARIDGRFYAIKKITSKSATTLKTLLQEVVVLSRLNHPNVVRYFTAWLDESPEDAETHIDQLTTTEETMSSSHGIVFSGLPSVGHDFMSSGRYANADIQFEDDTDEEGGHKDTDSVFETDSEEDEADEDLQHHNRHLNQAISRRKSQSSKSTLYIQMEYCENHTLRDVIKQGLWDNLEEQWRYFRQVVEGLAHMHGNGIIHRDLKPENVFIDVAKNPKIGDFGLATSGLLVATKPSAAYQFAGSNTNGIGTVYYTAPELNAPGSGQYNAKVDMYALGIMFFEMCHQLPTLMERDQTLQRIRRRDHVLPPSFSSTERQAQADIIQSLITHRAEDRPTAVALLKSGKIPEPFKEVEFRKALSELSQTDPTAYQKHLAGLFGQVPSRVQDRAWDFKSQAAADKEGALISGLVKHRLCEIFRRHGAVAVDNQPLMPVSELYPSAVKLLDPSGMVVQLPYDLTGSTARSIGRRGPQFEKTYCFDHVYRAATKGSEPRRISEVDFDIVSEKSTNLATKEAELLKLLDEVIEAFPPLTVKKMVFHINHSDLLDTVLNFCRIPQSQWSVVKESLPKLNAGIWSAQDLRNHLRDESINVASTAVDDLLRFHFRDTIENVQRKLDSIMANTSYVVQVAPVLARLRSIVQYCNYFQVKRPIYLQPLSCFNDKLYRGSFLFQCLGEGKRKNVIAVGGRYDKLIENFHTQETPGTFRAVGFQLNWEEITAMIVAEGKRSSRFLKGQKNSMDAWKPRRCDVLVTSFDPVILRSTGLQVLEQIWANGVSAELSEEFESLEALIIRYKEDNPGWVVMIRHDAGAVGERGIRVRNLIKKEETEVSLSDIVPFLKTELRERNDRDSKLDSSNRLTKQTSHHQQDASSLADPSVPNLDVHVLSTQHKGKKTNRRQIVEAAGISAKELVQSFLTGAQCAAIETSDDTLEAMRDTRLSDQESWKTLIQNAAPNERKYLQQVHDLLTSFASEGRGSEVRHAFVFNFRTRNCILYDLGSM